MSDRTVARVAMGAQVVYLGLTFGWRTWSQYRSTGDTGFRLGRGAPPVGRADVALALADGVTGVVGTMYAKPSGRRASPERVAALVGMAAGVVGTYGAQRDMGESWRVGVDERESASLITSGLFRYVRNPVFSFMTLVWVSSAVAVPNAATAAGAAMLAAGLDLEVAGTGAGVAPCHRPESRVVAGPTTR